MNCFSKAAALAAFGILAGTLGAAAQNIGGSYSVKGTNFDGSGYSGTANISITSNTTCRITWKTGGSSSTGICMRNQNSFAAAYVLGGKTGLVIYQLNSDGTMSGVWTIADQSGAGTETLTPR